MSARKTDMHRLQEVIRLHRLGKSRRTIARQLRMGRDTIRGYVETFSNKGLLDGTADDLPDLDALRAIVSEVSTASAPAHQTSSIKQWEPKIVELCAKGAGPTAIHDHLRLQYGSQYSGSLSAVKRLCVRLARESGPASTDVAIPVETDAGEVAQVDFGYAGKRYDPDRGVLRKCWVFVMTLAFSRHMYADLVFDQKVGTWLDLHVAAFECFQGVPRVIVPDYVTGHIIRVMCPARLCSQTYESRL